MRNSLSIGVLIFAVVANLLFIVYAFSTYEGIETWQAATRFTARVSLTIFAVFFVSWTLDKNPPRDLYWLLALAISHLIHLYYLLTYNGMKGGVEWNIRLIGGITAYTFIVTIPLFGFAQWLKATTFERYKTVGIYVIWFVMMGTYVPRILGNKNNAGGSMIEFYLGFGLTIVLMFFHLYKRFSTKSS